MFSRNTANNYGNTFGSTYTNSSLLPLGSTAANVVNTLRSNVNNLNKTVSKVVQNTNTAVLANTGGLINALGIFVGVVVLFLVLMYFFSQQISQGYQYTLNTVRDLLGLHQTPNPDNIEDGEDVTQAPIAPQDETEAEKDATRPLVEKILPNMNSQVFNVSKNTFTSYDAEPLCRALGAELATYDQVKTAWEKGADWCNYGWVKGQTAVYPTQKESWDRLQAGPEEQRTSCGVPGLNGGYFDNPELRFGVNCYGPKPSQSQHDEALLMNKGQPQTPEALEVNKKVAKFRTEASSLGVLPFNSDKWGSY